jgi:hypothetical protein
VLKVEPSSERFHARHSAIARYYLYQISTRRTAFAKDYVWWVKGEMDVKLMENALKLFCGRHDFRSFTERANEQGMAIELAIRQWARNDPMAAAAAAIVDAARLKTASSLYRSLGLSARDADARAVLFYAFLFGQSMMFLDEAPRKRASLIAACARVLMDVEQR